jgi:Putative heavy-metal-binding
MTSSWTHSSAVWAAVVGRRFDCNEIGDIMSEVVTYGTAVTVESAVAAETGMISSAARWESMR